MNSSSNMLNNMATFEGFNINYHGIMSSSNNEFAMPHDDQMVRSSVPVFDRMMPHFFPSMMPETEIMPVFDPMMPHFFPSMMPETEIMPVFDPMMPHFFPSMMPETEIMLVFDPMMPHFFPSMMPETEIMLNSSPSVSGAAFLGPHNLNNKNHQEQNHGAKKRKRSGQATDSQRLAERLRREKKNDNLRCLQDLVPGCYKTMGMAVMLDVIINYVRSLQNQIDLLSMELAAASLFYDFNSSEAEAMEALQGNMTGYEGGMEKVVGEGYGGISQFQNAAWPL